MSTLLKTEASNAAVLKTDRLVLRPLTLADAPAVQTLCGNWNVARMLSVVPHPYPDGLAETWIAGVATARGRGDDHVFAIEHSGELVGAAGIEKRGDAHELGYWIAEAWWGRGLASETATRLVRHAFEDLGLKRLTSGYFDENLASGRVLEKCGFRITGKGELKCVARGRPVPATLVELTAREYAARKRHHDAGDRR
ncbi:MAG: GNAT family N-acetyltransferase [Alphaproteobacteria bacterium]|nr:GNAT family N-acetyltransferase [Alphaproteobacteria bacterium]